MHYRLGLDTEIDLASRSESVYPVRQSAGRREYTPMTNAETLHYM